MSLRPNRFNVDLQQWKSPWLAYCRQKGINPSQAIRQIVAERLADAKTEMPIAQRELPSGHSIRKEVRLTQSELQRAENLAWREGFSLNRWIVALVNSRLDGSPQLGHFELEVLARSNLQLLAIGRNLNQLARAANLGMARESEADHELMAQLCACIGQHVSAVSAVLKANVSRWRR